MRKTSRSAMFPNRALSLSQLIDTSLSLSLFQLTELLHSLFQQKKTLWIDRYFTHWLIDRTISLRLLTDIWSLLVIDRPLFSCLWTEFYDILFLLTNNNSSIVSFLSYIHYFHLLNSLCISQSMHSLLDIVP